MQVFSKRVVGAFVVAVALGACGGGSNSATTSTPTTSATGTTANQPAQGGSSTTVPADGHGVVLHASLTVTGALAFTSTFDEPLDVVSCAEVGTHGTTDVSESDDPAADAQYATPEPLQNDDGSPGSISGGHTYAGGAAVGVYTGPGTYTGDAFQVVGAVIDTPVDDPETNDFQGDPTSATVVTKSDGSGSLVWTNWQDTNGSAISGSLIWTCT